MPKHAHDSQFDPLRPRLNSAEDITPHYEDRVLIRRLPQPETERGLEVPDNARKKSGVQRGIVIATAKGMTFVTDMKTDTKRSLPHRMPMTVKPGDEVLYERREINEFEINGGTYTFIFEEQSVLAIIGKHKGDRQ